MTVEEFDTALSDLETRVDRLRALYENWFRGYEKSEPSVARKEVERRVYQLRKDLPRNTALRFRYHQLYQRYTTLATYWQRTARQIEEGTYKLQLVRLKRRNDQRPARRQLREGEEEKDRPQSFELDLDESLNVDDLLDEAELDEVARALDAPGPHSELPPRPAAGAAVFAKPGGTGTMTMPRPAALPGASAKAAPAGEPALRPAASAPGLPVKAPAPAPFGGMPNTGKLPAPAGLVAKPPLPGTVPLAAGPRPVAPAAPRPAVPVATVPQGGTLAGVGNPPPRPQAPPLRPAEPSTGMTALPGAVRPAANVSPDAALRPRPAAPPAPPGAARPAPPNVPPARDPAPTRPGAPAAAQLPARAPEGAPRPNAPLASAGTFVGRPPLASPIAGSSLNEQRMKRIYDEYAAARRRNNEGEVRYEALVGSIQKMLPELSKKHQGKQIDFEVVVKDGRVGLKPKAT